MTDEPEDPKGLTVTVIGTGRAASEMIAALHGKPAPQQANPSPDPISLEPTISGPHGRAWFTDPKTIWAKHGQEDAVISDWIIEAPWAHPHWHSYWLCLVHLRPMPGVSTIFYREGATHELWVYALDPKKSRTRHLIDLDIPAILTPLNFAAQLREPGDEIAKEVIQAAVQDIVDGKLNPDTDARSQWAARFGDYMLKDRPGGMKRVVPGVILGGKPQGHA